VPDLIIETDEGRKKITTRAILFSFQSIVSLKYSGVLTIVVNDKTILSHVREGQKARFWVGDVNRSNAVGNGIVRKIDIIKQDDKYRLVLSIINETFNDIFSTGFSGKIRGELSRVMRSILSSIGVSIEKTYNGVIPVYEFQEGFLYDVLNSITRPVNIVWNVSGDDVYVGDILSGDSHKVRSFKVAIGRTTFKSIDNRSLKKTDISKNYSPDMKAGDRIVIGNTSYIIADASHSYSVLDRGPITRSTNLVLVETLSVLLSYIEVMDDDKRIEDLINNKVPDIKYDPEFDSIVYKEHEKQEYLGELETATFTTTWGVPDDYLYFEGGREWFPRRPEATDYDFEDVDFVDNTNWQDVDVSSIVPLGTRMMKFSWEVEDNLAGSRIAMREKGLAGTFQVDRVGSTIANTESDAQFEVFLSRSGIFEVQFNPRPSLWSFARFTISGVYV
jgi:hypothetical protein